MKSSLTAGFAFSWLLIQLARAALLTILARFRGSWAGCGGMAGWAAGQAVVALLAAEAGPAVG